MFGKKLFRNCWLCHAGSKKMKKSKLALTFWPDGQRDGGIPNRIGKAKDV